jgi:hypothetical protein
MVRTNRIGVRECLKRDRPAHQRRLRGRSGIKIVWSFFGEPHSQFDGCDLTNPAGFLKASRPNLQQFLFPNQLLSL